MTSIDRHSGWALDLERIYHDIDGNPCNILDLVRSQPEWAANRIQAGEKAIKGYVCLLRHTERTKEHIDTPRKKIVKSILSKLLIVLIVGVVFGAIGVLGSLLLKGA